MARNPDWEPTTSTRGWEYFYQGMPFSGATGLYISSQGAYDPFLGRWQQPASPAFVIAPTNIGDGWTGDQSTSLWSYLPGAINDTVTGMETEIGSRAADIVNDGLYDATFLNSYLNSGFDLANTQGISLYNGSLSQMGQLLDSGQTSWAAATFSSVPVIGSGYNVITGTDLLTGQSLNGLNYAAAWSGLVADVAFTGAWGLGLIGYNPTLSQFASDVGSSIVRAPNLFGYEWAIGSEGDGSVVLGANRFLRRIVAGNAGLIQAGKMTTYQDSVERSVVSDDLEGHELWQNANLKAQELAPTRLSTLASQDNPVIALDSATHAQITYAQQVIDAASPTPIENINTNATLLRLLDAAPEDSVSQLQQMATQHAQNYGY